MSETPDDRLKGAQQWQGNAGAEVELLSSAATDWSSGVAVNEEYRKVGRFGLFIRECQILAILSASGRLPTSFVEKAMQQRSGFSSELASSLQSNCEGPSY